jgi:hypothetical protein
MSLSSPPYVSDEVVSRALLWLLLTLRGSSQCIKTKEAASRLLSYFDRLGDVVNV